MTVAKRVGLVGWFAPMEGMKFRTLEGPIATARMEVGPFRNPPRDALAVRAPELIGRAWRGHVAFDANAVHRN
jgi:hypothetical protein